MMPETNAAMERVRRVLSGEDGRTVYATADWQTFYRLEKDDIVRAFLAEHADDAEPVPVYGLRLDGDKWLKREGPDGVVRPVLYFDRHDVPYGDCEFAFGELQLYGYATITKQRTSDDT